MLPIDWSKGDNVDLDENILLEPSPEAILKRLCDNYLNITLYNAFLESMAAEQGARMAAMESATDNAIEMVKELTLIYNRQRQAQITTELSEIVAGSEALVN